MNSQPDRQLWLPLVVKGELGVCDLSAENPTEAWGLMERIIAPENLRAAYGRVISNKGAPGIRMLGIPTVLDRTIQQAVLQVLQPEWDPTFSEGSYGFRPGRSAHQAVARAREYYLAGAHWVVDLDLEKFFDRVNHDKLMGLVEARVPDWRVRHLIRCYLAAGMMCGDVYVPRLEGTPQGGPLSPLLANLLLDELDRELTARGHGFVRYADDCNIYVCSRRAGVRVMRSISRFLTDRLKLKVNEAKSAVDRPRERGFLGFSIVRGGKIAVSEKARERVKARIRELTSRKRGCSLHRVISELANYLRGWKAYFRIATARSKLRPGLEHQQIGAWALAYKQEPGAGHCPADTHFR